MVACRELGFHGTTRIFSQTGYEIASSNSVINIYSNAIDALITRTLFYCGQHSIQLYSDSVLW